MEHDGIVLDYSRQKLTLEVKNLLMKLAERAQVKEKMVVLWFVDESRTP